MLAAGLNGLKAGCACVCLVSSHAKWHGIAKDKDQPCSAVKQGSELFKKDQDLKMSLTLGACLMKTCRKKKQDITQGGSENDRTLLRALQVLLSHAEGADELSPPGLWALGSTSQQLRLSCQHFPPWALSASVSIFINSLHRGLHLRIFCCNSLDWASWRCSSSGKCRRARCLRAQPCSASGEVAVTAGKIPLHGSSLGVFALQMCTETHQVRGLPGIGGWKHCSTVRSRSGWWGGFCLLVQ